MVLQGTVLHLRGQEQGGVIPLVPVAQRQEKPDGRQGRFQVRQDQGVEDLEIARAVNLAGFRDLMGDRLDEVLHQDDQPGAHEQGQQDRPVAVPQVQRLHDQQVEGDQAGGEQGGEVDVEHDPVPQGEVLPLECVTCHGDDEQADQRSAQGQADRDDVGADHLVRGAEEQLIGIGG